MAILKRLSRNKPSYSPEGIGTTVLGGAFIAYGVWTMIKERIDAREKAKEAGISRPLAEIRNMLNTHYLNDQWLAKASPVQGPIPAYRIAERVYRPGKATSDVLACFKEGVDNLEKFLGAIKTHLEPMAKAIYEEDRRLCELADTLDVKSDEDCDRLDDEIKKSIAKLKFAKPPIEKLRSAAKWYLPGLALRNGHEVYFDVVKPSGLPATIKALDSKEIKEAAKEIIRALDILDHYIPLESRNFIVSNDDGENLRNFYDYTHHMDDYYDIVDHTAWEDVIIYQPFKGIVDACQGMMYYIEQSLKI